MYGLQEQIEIIENSKLKNLVSNSSTRKTTQNIIELIKSNLFKTTEHFKKSLQLQSSVKLHLNEF